MTIKLTIIFILTSTFLFTQNRFDTKVYGQQILDGKVIYDGTNEEKMFRTLDSLLCKDKNNKVFYFSVSNKIQSFTDGALTEYFAGIARKYYFGNTNDFLTNTSKMTSKDLNNWLGLVAYDLALDEKDIKKLPKIQKRLDGLVTKCNNRQKDILKKCNDNLYKQIKFNLENL